MATIKQLTDAYASVNAGRQPSPEILGQLNSLANLSVNGPVSDAQALGYILNSADKTTSLALLSYQFFTGKSPTQAGLAYLTNSPDNPNDLNDAYYAGFSLEDRYINFAGNLATAGESATTFAAKYGALNFSAYVASIYETIVGGAYAKAAGVDAAAAIAGLVGQHDALLAKAQASGLITAGMSAAQVDLALKAVTAGYLMSQTVQSDVGKYASAANNFMVAQITDKATYNTDLTTGYAAAPGAGGGDGHATGSDFTFYIPPPPPPPEPEPEPDPDPAHAFTLTTSADTLTGQGSADTFTGVATYAGTTENVSSTFNAALDVLNGAGGYDTLSLTIGGNAMPRVTLDPTKIRNIERLKVTSTAVVTVTLTGTSFTELVNDQSSNTLNFNGFGSSVTKLGLSNLGARTTTFSADGAALTGVHDAVTLSLTSVGTTSSAASVTIKAVTAVANEYETLNIVSSGSLNNITLITDAVQTSLATINISGAAPLTLLLNNDRVRVASTIDASAATGGVTLGNYPSTNTLGATDHTVILGTGANIVYFGANLTAADTVDGHRGDNDTVAVGVAVTAADLSHLTGVEALRFSALGSMTQDVSLLPTGMRFDAELLLGGEVSFTHLSNNATVDLFRGNGGATLTLVLAADTSASDALTLRFNAPSGSSSGLFRLTDVSGLETLNIVSGGGASSNSISDDLVAARHVVTGNVDLSLGLHAGGSVDASAFTGKLSLTTSGIAADAIGGTGDDTFIGDETIADRYQLGAQGRNAQSGADHVYLSANDIVAFVGNAPTGTGAASTYASVAEVRDGVNTGAVRGVIATFSADDHDFSLKNAAGTAFTGLAKGSVSQGLAAGDTMVVQSLAGSDGAVAATANVTLIKLTGQVSLNNSGDVKTLFADAIGSASITGLAADANYLVVVFDAGSSNKTVFAVVNTGASGAGDTTLSAADFTDSGVALIGQASSTSLLAAMSLGAAF